MRRLTDRRCMKSRSLDTLSETESLVVLPKASEISPAVFLSFAAR